MLASKSILHIDTLNSKIHPLVIILSRNRDEQKYISPPTAFLYQNEIVLLARTNTIKFSTAVLYSTVHWNTPQVQEESSGLCVGRYSQGTFTLILLTL